LTVDLNRSTLDAQIRRAGVRRLGGVAMTQDKGGRAEDDIEFFATLPGAVDPHDQKAVRKWLNELATSLTLVKDVAVHRRKPPSQEGVDPDPGAWFAITVIKHPICPGRGPGPYHEWEDVVNPNPEEKLQGAVQPEE
jgi:hypothetical protein